MLWNRFLCTHSSLQWRHNKRDGVSNHQRLYGLLSRLFRRRSKQTSKFRVTGLCEGNSPVTGEFPSQKDSNAENVSIWWRHHVQTLWIDNDGPCGLTKVCFGNVQVKCMFMFCEKQKRLRCLPTSLCPGHEGIPQSEICFHNQIIENGLTHCGLYWRYMATRILVNFCSGNGLLPGGTNPLPEPMLINRQWGPVV